MLGVTVCLVSSPAWQVSYHQTWGMEGAQESPGSAFPCCQRAWTLLRANNASRQTLFLHPGSVPSSFLLSSTTGPHTSVRLSEWSRLTILQVILFLYILFATWVTLWRGNKPFLIFIRNIIYLLQLHEISYVNI